MLSPAAVPPAVVAPVAAPPAADLLAGGILDIDLDALAANYRHLAQRCHPARCGGVIKADAYGLGAPVVLLTLRSAGCTDFFVAHLSEALALHTAFQPGERCFILNGLLPGAEAACAALPALIPVLNSREQLARWATLGLQLGRPLPAALQLDTGMSRMGMSPAELTEVAQDRRWHGGLQPVLIMSHLARADEPEVDFSAVQLARFRAALADWPGVPASLANSAGIFLGPDYHFDLCRPGAALYGLRVGSHSDVMQPVVRLRTRITQWREVPAGACVGYGSRYVTPTAMRLATVPVGYADGLHRATENPALWLGEQRLPVLGRISMDSLVVDVSAVPADAIGPDTLLDLIGPHQDPDHLGLLGGTIGYEVLTSLSRRYARRYTGTLAHTLGL